MEGWYGWRGEGRVSYLNEFVGDEVTNDAIGVNDLLSFNVALY